MVNARGYISSNFTKTFLTIFLPFFLIVSLVYLVKVSTITAKIQLSFGELLTLYGYFVPEIIFYTLPISFIAALASVLIRLSLDNELTALYALGLKAHNVLKSLMVLGILFSLLLAAISFLAIPLSNQLYQSFKTEKRADTKLNIVPGKLGQKFGDYYIYIKENDKNGFSDIVIYNRTHQDEEQFFSSRKGKIKHTNRTASLQLEDGYGYTYTKDKLQQAKYKTLEVYDTGRKKEAFRFKDILNYWGSAISDKKTKQKVIFFAFLSLIPFLSVYIVASFSMINSRYQSNHLFFVIFITSILFYLIGSFLQKSGGYIHLLAISLLLFTAGRWLFEKRVAKYF